METISFNIHINAPREKVWETMLADKTYREWTTAFHEGSYYEGSWEKGEAIYFIGPSKDGKKEGMYARVKENIPNEFISIQHLGLYTDGVIDTTSEEVKKWAPALENYTFTEKDGGTELKVEMEVEQQYKKSFEEMWPRALLLLKALSEK